MGLAVVILFLPFSFRVVAVPGCVRLQRALHLFAVARQQQALHLLVAARQADHKHPALFLSRRGLRPEARWQAAPCHPAAHLVCHEVWPVRAARLPPLLQAESCHPVAPPACHEVCPAQMGELHRPLQAASCHPVAHRVYHEACLVQMAEPPRPVLAELWHPVAGLACHEACPAQMVQAKHLLELLSPQAVPARVYLADRGQPAPFQQAQRLDSRQQPVMGRLAARPRELAGECSSDFRS